MIDDDTFLNKPNFTKMVENKVLDTKQSYIDAVIDLLYLANSLSYDQNLIIQQLSKFIYIHCNI